MAKTKRRRFKLCVKCGVKPATMLPATGEQLCRHCFVLPSWNLADYLPVPTGR